MNINRVVQRVVSAVITFLLSFTFLVVFAVGITVAFFSGAIEYAVMGDLVPLGYQVMILWVVVAFETLKCLLVFLDRSMPEEHKNEFKFARRLLILVSLSCTMFFCFHALHNPNQAEVKADKLSQILALQDVDAKGVNAAFDKEAETISTRYAPLIAEQVELREAEKANTFGPSKKFIGPRYKALQAEIERLEGQRDRKINAVELRRQTKLESLAQSLDQKVKRADEESHSLLESGSEMIISTLKILNFNKAIPEGQYIFMVGFLSLLLTVTVESTILVSFGILAKAYGDEFRQQKKGVDLTRAQDISTDAISDVLKISEKTDNKIMDKLIGSTIKKAQAFKKAILDNLNIKN